MSTTSSQKSHRNYSYQQWKKELVIMKESQRRAVQDIKANIISLIEVEKTRKVLQHVEENNDDTNNNHNTSNITSPSQEENILKQQQQQQQQQQLFYHLDCSDQVETKMEPSPSSSLYQLQIILDKKNMNEVSDIKNLNSNLIRSNNNYNDNDNNDGKNYDQAVSNVQAKPEHMSTVGTTTTTTTTNQIPTKRKSKYFNNDKQVLPILPPSLTATSTPATAADSKNLKSARKASATETDKKKQCVLS